jgi:alkylated DNA repair dioxygenase AlkB
MHYQHIRSFLTNQEADYLYQRLLNEIPWTQVKYYKPERGYVITPRLTWVAGFHQEKLYPLNHHAGYQPNEIPDWLVKLKDVVEDYLQEKYNFILFAQYRDENDSITYHSDDEKFLGYNPSIASITVGENRPFCLKNKQTKEVTSFELKHGDLFVMQNNCQRDYLHSVPKQKYSCAPRISLTFRKALNEAGSKNYYHYNTTNSIF